MNQNENYIHDAYMAMAERTIKRLWISTILGIILTLITNVGWLIYESQFELVETTTYTATQKIDDIEQCTSIKGIEINEY